MKILVIRFSSMGDVILTSPVVRCLKQQLPGVEVHYLTKKQQALLLEANPYIDRLHLLEKNGEKALIEVLQALSFDVVIDLHHNLRSMRFKLALSGKKYSFKKLNFRKWLLVRWKQKDQHLPHVVDRYLAAFADLGVKNDGRGLDFFIPERCSMPAATFEPALAEPFVAFSIGGQHATKKLPAHKIAEICRSIEQPIVLMGGPEDAAVADQVLANCPHPRLFSSCGKLNMGQSADLLRQASLVISHDTALMHLAAAFGRKTLAIWGNTVPQLGMTPYLAQAAPAAEHFEVAGLSCRPCSKIGFSSCPEKHFRCMELQNSAAIAQSTQEWFKKHK